ncbi:MAG: hypothetical protein ABIZ80_22000 [Bryobacteraceae bacterium]
MLKAPVYNAPMTHAAHLRRPMLLMFVLCPIVVSQNAILAAKHPRDQRSEEEARKVINAYFPLFSKHDAKGLLSVVNFPHIRVTDAGTLIVPSAKEWTGDPTPLEEHYHHTELDSLTFVQSNAVKAHALVVFSRYKADGKRYISYPTLWIVTKVNGHWGIQVRSSFAP